SAAALTFPAPVSWVEVDWNIDDPLDKVAAAGLQLDLKLEPATAAAPTLVDLGATSTVYTSLRQGQEAELSSGPSAAGTDAADDRPWSIHRGVRGRLTPFALGPKQPAGARAEGWAHVMDRKNCLALAVSDFAQDTRDRIIAAADGTVTFWREYGSPKKP